MTVMGKIGVGVATAVLSAAAVAMLGLGGGGNSGGNSGGGGFQATQSYSGLCVTTMGSCQVQPMPRGSNCGCYNAFGQAFYGSVQ